MPPAVRGSASGQVFPCPDCDKTFSRKEVRSLPIEPAVLVRRRRRRVRRLTSPRTASCRAVHGSAPPLEAQSGEALPVRALLARVQSQVRPSLSRSRRTCSSQPRPVLTRPSSDTQRPSEAALQDVRAGQGGEGRGRRRRLVDRVPLCRLAAGRLDVGHVARPAAAAFERGLCEASELLVVQPEPEPGSGAAGGADPPCAARSLPR